MKAAAHFAILIALAGCGGGSDSPSTTGTSNDSPTSTAAPAQPGGAAPTQAPPRTPVATTGQNGQAVAAPAPDPAEAAPPAPVASTPSTVTNCTTLGAQTNCRTGASKPITGSPAVVRFEEDPAPAANKVSGKVVLAALKRGVTAGPVTNPYAGIDRQLTNAQTELFYIDQRMASYTLGAAPWGSIVPIRVVKIAASTDGESVGNVSGNGLVLAGPAVPLASQEVELDKVHATWSNGEWSAKLLVQSTDNPAEIRVCWDLHLPPNPAITGPGGQKLEFPVPLLRLSCVLTGRDTVTKDVGAYVVDDYAGTVKSFSARW